MPIIPIYKFALREDLKDQPTFLPTRAETKASGWDVRAAIIEPLIVKPFEYVKVPLGFRAFCPEGWWLELKPRSSTFAKKNLHALYGTIDETYEGEMIFAAQWIPRESRILDNDCLYSHQLKDNELIIKPGESIGQLLPILRQEMTVEGISNEDYDILCAARNAQRGAGGFGSTSK